MMSFLGPRSRRRINAHTTSTPTVRTLVVVPSPRRDTADAYTWGVNALLESGQTDLAYELAAGYADEA